MCSESTMSDTNVVATGYRHEQHPRTHSTCARIRAKESRFLSQLITTLSLRCLFVAILSANVVMKCCVSLPQPPKALNTTDNPLIVVPLLLFRVVVECTGEGLVSVCRGVWVEYPYIKESLFTSLPEASCSDVNTSIISGIGAGW